MARLKEWVFLIRKIERSEHKEMQPKEHLLGWAWNRAEYETKLEKSQKLWWKDGKGRILKSQIQKIVGFFAVKTALLFCFFSMLLCLQFSIHMSRMFLEQIGAIYLKWFPNQAISYRWKLGLYLKKRIWYSSVYKI